MSDISVRLKTASLMLLGLGICLAFLPESALSVLVLALLNYSVFELFNVFQAKHKVLAMLINFGFVVVVASTASSFHLSQLLAVLIINACIITMLLSHLFKLNPLPRLLTLMISVFLVDAAFLASFYLYSLHGLSYLLKIWLSVVMVDAGGYIFGRMFGKHKLMPSISPKKTWEGMLGGFASLIILHYIWSFYLPPAFSFYTIYKLVIILVVAVFGDFWFSYVKRMLSVKDYGNILPGHGGVLDRIDALIFVLPTVVLLLEIFAKYGLVG